MVPMDADEMALRRAAKQEAASDVRVTDTSHDTVVVMVGLMRLVRRSRSVRSMVVHKRRWLSRGGTGSHSPTIHVARHE